MFVRVKKKKVLYLSNACLHRQLYIYTDTNTVDISLVPKYPR